MPEKVFSRRDDASRFLDMYDRGMEGFPGVTAFILAGGKSSRMGADKAFVDFEGRTLLARALGVARELCDDVRIVGSSAKFSEYGPVVEDVFRECGPLGGIHAALRASSNEINLMLAVDMPFVSRSLLRYLVAQARSAAGVHAVVPRCGGKLQPLCAVYRGEFCGPAEAALRAGRNKIGLLLEGVTTRMIEEDELQSGGFACELFRNLNTPGELERARGSGE
jgi:molybdopterin-guanine dinucleotide biosynthesis protein A